MSDVTHRLTRRVTDVGALRACWMELSKGRLALPDTPGVALLAPVELVIALGDREVAVLSAKAVHRVRGEPGELGLQIAQVPAEAQRAYERAMAQVASAGPAAQPVQTAQTAEPAQTVQAAQAPPAAQVGDTGRPIALRYPEMSPPEKMQIALRGDRDGRMQVMKEANPNLVKFLLQNPRTTALEVATLAGNAQSSLELLNMISAHPMLAQNESIRVALVKNPRAPAPLVKQHIEKLSQGQLAQLGKSPHVKDDVRRMALKLVLNRRA